MAKLRLPEWGEARTARFEKEYAEWEKSLRDVFLMYSGAENAPDIAKNSLNFSMMLDALPKSERDRYISNYRKMIDLDSIIQASADATNAGRPPSILRRIKGGKKGDVTQKGVYRISLDMTDPTTRKHALSPILSSLSLQYDTTADAADSAAYTFGANIRTREYHRRVGDLVSGEQTIKPNSSILVFDTETTGLTYDAAGVREIAAYTTNVTEEKGGRLAFSRPAETFHRHFKTSQMQYGFLADKGINTRNMMEVIHDMADPSKIVGGAPGSGPDFAREITVFLNKLKDADYVAGQNIDFDIGQILTGLTATGEYKNNPELRKLVDEVSSSLKSNGKIIDTLGLSQARLPDLKLAPELAFAGEASPYSLENIMLKTNFMDELYRDFGGDEVAMRKFLGLAAGGKMHQADVDTRLTAKLIDYHANNRLKESDLLERGLPHARGLARQISSEVLKSYAPVPVANIADVADIDKRLFNELLQEQENLPRGAKARMRFMDRERDSSRKIGKLRLSKVEGEDTWVLGGRLKGKKETAERFRGTSDELWEMLNGPESPVFMKAQITPLEQEIWKTRKLMELTPDVAPEDMLLGMGNVRKFFGTDYTGGGALNKMFSLFKRGVRPSEQSFEALQRHMAKRGIPFAGLSLPEHWLSSGMAQASLLDKNVAGHLPGAYKNVASVSEDMGISMFRPWEQVYTKGGTIASIPLDVVQAASEQAGLGLDFTTSAAERTGAPTFALSPFEQTAGPGKVGGKKVNLMLQLDEEQSQGLANWLRRLTPSSEVTEGKTLADWGVSSADQLEELASTVERVGPSYGVGVARLEGEAGDAAHDLLAGVMGQYARRDTQKIPFRASFLDMFEGNVRVGPWILDRLRPAAMEASHQRELGLAAKHLAGMTERAAEPGGHLLMNAIFFAQRGGPEAEKAARTALATYNKVRPKIPTLAGLALAGGVGYYMYKKHKEQKPYDETRKEMPIESASDYSNYRREMNLPPARPERTQDPLLTAGVVNNLDINKIKHTQMGAEKYASLYGGVF